MKIRFSFEFGLMLFLVVIIFTVSFSGFLAYKSLIELTAVMSQSKEPEVKLLLLKSISNDLSSAESSIKSYALSKDESYYQNYFSSLSQLKNQMQELDSMIPASSPQQSKVDSMEFYADQKISYLNAFAEMQKRGSVVNELNILTRQIEENKKNLARLDESASGSKSPANGQNIAEEENPGLLKRVFKSKEIKNEQEAKKKLLEEQAQKEEREKLNKQIALLENLRREILKVKAIQGFKLETFDEKELIITQSSKVYTEKFNACIVALQLYELANTRKIMLDIDNRHKRTDRLVSIFSVTAAILLIIIGFVVFSFIRKKNKYQLALLEAKAEAEKYSQLQEKFLANMSHEIRTPMNAIAGFTEQLLKTELKEKQKNQLGIVKQSVDHLLVVINDILDYARLRSDKLSIEYIPSSLHAILTETADLLEHEASRKGISLQVEIAPDIPALLMFDPVRMKQVLLNLIGNAIKFTGKGSVHTKAVYEGDHNSLAAIAVTITDTGIGISEISLEKIFDSFEQAELSTARKYGGSGLGLSITKSLVQLLNGSIEIASEEGKGTEIRLHFRLQYPENTEDSFTDQKDTLDIRTVLRGKHILIADDEEWNKRLLVTILEQYEVKYTVAQSGNEAIRLLQKQQYDLILMDVRMPDINGFEATKLIRKMPPPYAAIPVIGLTADTSDANVKLCYETGMNAVLGKPYSEKDLCSLIAETISHPSEEGSLSPGMKQDDEKPEAQQEDFSASFSMEMLIQMSNGDEEFLRKMIGIFCSSGKESFDRMKQALDENDYETAANMAHKMLPSARHLEATAMVSLLREIEEKGSANDPVNLVTLYQKAYHQFAGICSEIAKKYPTA